MGGEARRGHGQEKAGLGLSGRGPGQPGKCFQMETNAEAPSTTKAVSLPW